MAKLRHAWGGADRVYDAASLDTDTSTAQNVVEASGIDASLTSIQGEGRLIGTAQDVIIRGGSLDIDGNPSAADVMIDFIRLLDKSVIPNHATFTRGDGAVYRRPRTIGTPITDFTDGSGGNAWDFTHRRDVNTIVNKWLIKGLTIAGIPTEAEASAANSFLPAPWEYNQAELQSYLVDDPTWAQDLADWLLAETNGILVVATWTAPIDNDESLLGGTVTIPGVFAGASEVDVLVTGIRHHGDDRTAVSTFTAEYHIYE